MRTTIKFTVTDAKALHAAQPTLVQVKHVPAHDIYEPDHARVRAALKAGVVLPGVKVEASKPEAAQAPVSESSVDDGDVDLPDFMKQGK